MPIPLRSDLKLLFETGDTPNGADFAKMIDAIYDLAQANDEVAAAAADDAAAALAAVSTGGAKAFARFRYQTATPAGWKLDYAANCTVVIKPPLVSPEFFFHWTALVSFTAPLADEKYILHIHSSHGGDDHGDAAAGNITAAGFRLDLDEGTHANLDTVSFVVFR